MINREERGLLDEIKRINPAYLRVKYADISSNPGDLNEQTKNKNAVYLEYLWGEKTIYLLVMADNQVTLKAIKRDGEFNENFRIFLWEVGTGKNSVTDKGHFVNYIKSANFLFNRLVGDHIDGKSVKRLVVSADGPLSSFPFDALLTAMPDAKEVDYRLPYLVKKYSVSHVYSFTFMNLITPDKPRGNKLLAFGMVAIVMSSPTGIASRAFREARKKYPPSKRSWTTEPMNFIWRQKHPSIISRNR